MLPFHSRPDWRVAGFVTLSALVVYLLTLAPTVTLEQSGAFAVAGEYLGVGRVPGYPVWHILAHLFTRVFAFVTYRDHPNPAWALNFMSAVFGALSCGLVTLLVLRMTHGTAGGPSWTAAAPAISAGLLFAFSPTMWSQSVITETHTLTCSFLLAMLVLLFRWMDRPSPRFARLMGLFLGLAVAQSHLLALVLPAYLLTVLFVDWRLCMSFTLTCCLAAAVVSMVVWLAPPGALTWSGGFGLALLILLPIRFLPRGNTAVGMVLLMACGLLLFAYLPIASSGNPPMNFGRPHTWAGFLHVIRRGQYERIVPLNPLRHPSLFAAQIRTYLTLLRAQFTLPLMLTGAVPLVSFRWFRGIARKRWAVLLAGFLMLSVAVMDGLVPKTDVQTLFITRRFLIPSFALFAVFIGIGLAWLVESLPGRPGACFSSLRPGGSARDSSDERGQPVWPRSGSSGGRNRGDPCRGPGCPDRADRVARSCIAGRILVRSGGARMGGGAEWQGGSAVRG